MRQKATSERRTYGDPKLGTGPKVTEKINSGVQEGATERFQVYRIALISLLFAAGLIAFADRVNVSVATPEIMRELDWSVGVMGLVLSAFGWGYLVSQMGLAWLIDRWGGLRVLIFAITGWSVATILMAVPRSPLVMGLMRGLVGAWESAYGPAQAAIVTAHFSSREVGRVLGICQSSTALGALLAVPLATYILSAHGWRMVFYLFGAVGLVWAAAAYSYSYALKGEAGGLSKPLRTSTTNESAIPLVKLVRRPAVWGLALTYVPNAFTYYFVANWMPTYLNRARGFSLSESGLYTVLPHLCSFLFSILAGSLIGRLEGKGRSRSSAGKKILYVGFLGIGALLLIGGYTESSTVAVTTISVAMGLVGANITAFLLVATDIVPSQVGVVTGFMTTAGALGALLAPMVTGYLVQATGGWEYALYLTSAVNALAIVGVLKLISSNPTGTAPVLASVS